MYHRPGLLRLHLHHSGLIAGYWGLCFSQDGHKLGLGQSYAKNMGLYGQRIGCLSIVCDNPTEAVAVESQLKSIARPTYSNPPLHGASFLEIHFNAAMNS